MPKEAFLASFGIRFYSCPFQTDTFSRSRNAVEPDDQAATALTLCSMNERVWLLRRLDRALTDVVPLAAATEAARSFVDALSVSTPDGSDACAAAVAFVSSVPLLFP